MRRTRHSGGFTPIQLADYVRLNLKANSSVKEADITARLKAALKAYHSGARCHCGAPIWVIGSAEVGHMCFTCTTGEAEPSEDFEIAGACDKYRMSEVGLAPEEIFWDRGSAPWERHGTDTPPADESDRPSIRRIPDDDPPF